MAHWIGQTRDYNGFVRQVRSCVLNAPRVKRTTTKDLAITGYVYNDSLDAARNQSDIGFAIAETDGRTGVYRATCVKAGGSGSWDASSSVTVTITTANTIQDDANGNWIVTYGMAVGDLIRIEDAADAGNNNTFRISAINNNNATNDQLVVTTDDTLTNVVSDAVTVYPIGSGAIFEVEYDDDADGDPTADEHVGWLVSNVENYTKSFELWMTLNRGNADWVVGDYWQFEFEKGSLTFNDILLTTVEGVVISGTNILTLSALDQAQGVTWASLGFSDEDRIDIAVSSGTDTGIYRISNLTDSALTLQTTAGGAPGLTNETVTIQVTPKFEVSGTPVLNVVPADPTITRSDGGSWIDDGFVVDGHLELEGSVSNDAYWLIKTVTATVLTIDDSNEQIPMVTETLPATITVTPRNGALQSWSEHRFRLTASGETTTSDDDAISTPGDANGLLIRPDGEGNYVTEWIGIGPGIDPVNNPKSVHVGMQTQFSGSTRQNVEHRIPTVLSDATFSAMSENLNSRVYTYLSVGTTIETFFQFDGDHVVGFSDVNTATTSWFYQGFVDLHGTENQIALPYFLGGNGDLENETRDTSGDVRLSAFFNPYSRSSSSGFQQDPPYSCAWFRWADGQWFTVWNNQRNSTNSANTTGAENNLKIAVSPWRVGDGDFDNAIGNFFSSTGNFESDNFIARLGRTPTSFDASNRHYVLIPPTLFMSHPTNNVIADLRGLYCIPGVGGVSTKTRQTKGHRVFYMGQNHKDTDENDFAALELN